MIINDKDIDMMYLRFFCLIYGATISTFFAVYFYNKIYVVFPILLILYFMIKEIKNALILALPLEICYCENGIFYYKRILWKFIKIDEFSLNITDIEKIEDRKKIEKYGSDNVFMYGIYYFTYMKERIKITMKDERVFYLWVYNRQEDLIKFFENPNEDNRFYFKFTIIKSTIEDERKKLLMTKKLVV